VYTVEFGSEYDRRHSFNAAFETPRGARIETHHLVKSTRLPKVGTPVAVLYRNNNAYHVL